MNLQLIRLYWCRRIALFLLITFKFLASSVLKVAYYHTKVVTAASGTSQKFGVFDFFELFDSIHFSDWNIDPKRSTSLA